METLLNLRQEDSTNPEVRSLMRPIVSNRGTDLQRPDAENTKFIYIQGVNDLTPEQKDELKGLEVQFQEYLGNNTYLCRYVPPDLNPVSRKEHSKPS